MRRTELLVVLSRFPDNVLIEGIKLLNYVKLRLKTLFLEH